MATISLSDFTAAELHTIERYRYWDARVKQARKEYEDAPTNRSTSLSILLRRYRHARRWCCVYANRITPKMLEYMAQEPPENVE